MGRRLVRRTKVLEISHAYTLYVSKGPMVVPREAIRLQNSHQGLTLKFSDDEGRQLLRALGKVVHDGPPFFGTWRVGSDADVCRSVNRVDITRFYSKSWDQARLSLDEAKVLLTQLQNLFPLEALGGV
jgi:hypothetical protein